MKNIALIIGKKNSTGVPGKNTRLLLGRPLCEYAFLVAKHCSLIDRIYLSTDCDKIKNIGSKYGCEIIDRPSSLAQPESLTEDVLSHAYQFFKSENLSSITLLFCNNPLVDLQKLKEAIVFLNGTDSVDSCFSVCRYDMFSPQRARLVGADGMLASFLNEDQLRGANSIRDSQGAVYFCDFSIQVMKPRCIEKIEEGVLPFRWQGRNSKAIVGNFGFDIDSEWQIPAVEYELKKRGFTETYVPWEFPQV